MFFKSIFSHALQTLYPPDCRLCMTEVAHAGGLCPACWKDISFCVGQVCTSCGVPVAQTLDDDDGVVLCESCHRYPHRWARGRCALLYESTGRDIVLALKHADRTDLVQLCAHWMLQAGSDLLEDATLIVPVPLHWTRLLKRKYNQATEIGRRICAQSNQQAHFAPQTLIRTRKTLSQGHMTREDRYANVEQAFQVTGDVAGARVLLIDDVMTTGSTLDVCAQTLYEAGASRVDVLVLARVSQDFIHSGKTEGQLS